MTTIWMAELTGLHRGRAFATATGVCSLPWKNKAIYMVSIVYQDLFSNFVLFLLPFCIPNCEYVDIWWNFDIYGWWDITLQGSVHNS